MVNKPLHHCWIYLLGVLFFAVAVSTAQQKGNEIKLKLAQSYERARDYENAVKLYEEMYATDSSDMALFEALKRNYLLIKKYPEAIAIMNRALRMNPGDLNLLAQLGTVYTRNAEEAKAVAVWERALALDSTKEITYSVVASAMMEVRQFERAIETYKRGRIACKNEKLFISDLAYLYGSSVNYAEATREYMRLIQDGPAQLGFVQSRMTLFVRREEGLKAATEAVEQATASNTDNLTYSQLLAWLYMEGKRYDSAFDVYKRIDQKTNARGIEMFNFADRAFRDKAYETASKAYQEVIQKYPAFQFISQVKFGYARTLEELNRSGDTLQLFGLFNPFEETEKPATESEPKFTGTITAYKRIVNEYPKTEIAARSLLRIATLNYERFFNLDEAQSTLNDLLKNYTQFIPLIGEGKVLLGDVYLAQGNLDKAEETFTSLNDLRPVSQELRDKAGLRLAEITYFRFQFKKAVEMLGNVIHDVTSNTTNDALTLQIFVQANQEENSAALSEFAKADFLKRQRKLSEALAIYKNIFDHDTTSELAGEALLCMGDMSAQMHRFTDAVASYERLTENFEENISLDRATMKIGQIYEYGLRDKAKAIEAYQRLLEKFPNSIYVSEARKKIRELRGDTI